MNISEDYFLLYHGIRHHQLSCYLDIKFRSKDDLLGICAIFLSINRKNYHRFLPIPLFKELTKKYFKNDTNSIDEIYDYQYNILEILSSNLSLSHIERLLIDFNILKKQNIITIEEYGKLSNIFKIAKTELNIKQKQDHITTIKRDKISKKEYYYTQKSKLSQLIDQLQSITNTTPENAKKKLETKNFSIGITGIINSGKSTMLNALLGKKVLGTSVIPETANLSIIKHSNKSRVIVKFWNKSQWEKIKESSKNMASLKDFVKETENIFKDAINSYIREKNRIININIEQLTKYTSASDPSKLCNLVHSVELYDNVGFLEQDTMIVDTPGLNDPMVLREDITKEYLQECDILIHLMNVNQVATATDIKFILDTLLYNNISKLIIVLTKADTISQRELEEVLDYTKLSIKQALERQNKASKFDFVLSKIEFFSLKAKEALVCKTDAKKAKELGYCLEDSGILDIQNSIRELLYSEENQKNIILLHSIKNELLDFINTHIDQTKFELQLLSKSKDEVEEILKEIENKKKENDSLLNSLTKDIEKETLYIKEQIKVYEKSIHIQLSNLKDTLISRITDDIRYELKKNKTIPKVQRLHYIFSNGKQDGLMDIARDFNYTLWKLISKAKDKIYNKYKDKNFILAINNEYNQTIDISIINKIVLKNEIIILEKISNFASKATQKNIEKLKSELSQEMQSYFDQIEKELTAILNNIESLKLKELNDELSKPLSILKNSIHKKEKGVLERLKHQENDEIKKEQKRIDTYEKLAKLRDLKDMLKVEF